MRGRATTLWALCKLAIGSMNLFFLLALIAFALYGLKSNAQKRRIALLASHLGKYQIESLMESLTEGYLRALGEKDPERSGQIWGMLRSTEITLCEQFNRFAAEFAKVDAALTRVSRLPLALPFADTLFPAATFDLRQVLKVHAQGISQAASQLQEPRPQDLRDQAFTMSAELFLMQHTCHWFCRSKAVASARMLTLHKTPYAQLLASVAPATRKAYTAVVEG